MHVDAEPLYLSWFLSVLLVITYFVFLTQLLALERERTQKWVKMVKNWDKYIRGEKVNI